MGRRTLTTGRHLTEDQMRVAHRAFADEYMNQVGLTLSDADYSAEIAAAFDAVLDESPTMAALNAVGMRRRFLQEMLKISARGHLIPADFERLARALAPQLEPVPISAEQQAENDESQAELTELMQSIMDKWTNPNYGPTAEFIANRLLRSGRVNAERINPEPRSITIDLEGVDEDLISAVFGVVPVDLPSAADMEGEADDRA